MFTAFTDEYDWNIIVMDWAFLAGDNYLQVVTNVRHAAEDLVILLEKIDYKIHLVGFGIGAHLAGAAGRISRRNHPIGRITGYNNIFFIF